MTVAQAARQLSGTPIERVQRMAQLIREGGDEAQKLRHLPDWLTDALINEGIFRFAIPEELGGENASVRETIEVIEAISAIDGSVGWNVMIGSEINAMAAGGMPDDLAKEVYIDNPRVIMCGGGGPGTKPAKAIPHPDGGYKIYSQSSFQSGIHNSEWCFQSAPICDENGEPVLNENGQPTIRTWFINKSQFEILDTWDVGGLRGSGSHDVKVDGAHVTPKWEPVQLILPARYPNPVYRIPTPMRLSYNKVAVALGVARGMVDAFTDLAMNKTPFLSATMLKDRPIAQYRLGEAEATLRAARAFVMEAMDGLTDSLANGEPEPSYEATKIARLACTFGSQTGMHVADLMHNTAGTSASYMTSPMERKLRDAHACASHRWVGYSLYDEIGRQFLGHPPTPAFF